MKKVISTTIFASLVLASSIMACETSCFTCPEGPVGPIGPQGIQGIQGEQGIPGTNGTNGVNGIDGKDGINGTNGLNGSNAYLPDYYKGGIAGTLALSRIDHPKNNGTMIGIGLSDFEDSNAIAIGIGKSWLIHNSQSMNEITLDFGAFIADHTQGVSASINFHFK